MGKFFEIYFEQQRHWLSLGPVGHRYEKKYFLSSDFCQQFELKVIIWCLGARNFANCKSVSILRYAQQNIFENIRKIVLTCQQQQMPAKTCSVYVLDFLIRIISGDTVVNIYSL